MYPIKYTSLVLFLIQIQIIAIVLSQEDDPDYIKIQSELELIQWDLQDECSDMARNERKFYMQDITGLRDKIRGETDHADFLRTHAHRLKTYEDVPYDMHRNWTYFTKSGDVLLSRDQYKALDVFANKNLELKLTDVIEIDPIANSTEENHKFLKEQDVFDLLSTNRNASTLQEVWTKWEAGTKPFREWYGHALKLTSSAATENDCDNVESYWELLSDIPSGYELSRKLFDEIKPLYDKLTDFVRVRINNHYNTTFEQLLPYYLTGTFMADDWSNIADILLPNPQLYFDVKGELDAREIYDFYSYAGNTTKNLGFGDIASTEFFKRSQFDVPTCDTKILNFCAEHYSSVLTCNRTRLSNYFQAYEDVMQIALTKVNFHAQVRQVLRHSPVISGMSSMSSLLAINGLIQNRILERNVFSDDIRREENRMTVMLLLALRILPKIAYYHTMDQFRLDILENDGQPEDIFKTHRERFQQINSNVEDSSSEFLREESILYNKPYLSHMLGEFLQFQLVDYYQIDLFEDADISTLFNKDSTFRDFVMNIPNRETEELLSYYYNIDEISADALLTFFAPLEEYLENAPLEQSPYKVKKAKYVKPITTTTTPAPKSTRKPKSKTHHKTKPQESLHRSSNGTKIQINEPSLELEDTKQLGNTNNQNATAAIPIEQAKPQIGVYIGAAIVLVALGAIVIGFIMQRRRTHQNNRRYNA